MTLNKAIIHARKLAKKYDDFRYIVFEDEEYEVATDHDLDTYFYGCRVIHTVCPDGFVE